MPMPIATLECLLIFSLSLMSWILFLASMIVPFHDPLLAGTGFEALSKCFHPKPFEHGIERGILL